MNPHRLTWMELSSIPLAEEEITQEIRFFVLFFFLSFRRLSPRCSPVKKLMNLADRAARQRDKWIVMNEPHYAT